MQRMQCKFCPMVMVILEREITPDALPTACVHCSSKRITKDHSRSKRIVVIMKGMCNASIIMQS